MPVYEEIISRLRQNDFDSQKASNFLYNFNNVLISRFLLEILQNESLLTEVASRSYIHQLGFHKFVLGIVKETGVWLRLHYWPNPIHEVNEDIHDHCASFVSHVLQGSLQHAFYIKILGDTFLEYEYCFNEATKEGSSILKGTTDLKENGIKRVDTGCIYYLDAELLHQVNNVIGGTMTISLWGPRIKNASVIRSKEKHTQEMAKRSGMTRKTAQNSIQTIYNQLENLL